MSIPFSRSMRSLKIDSYRASLFGILLAGGILLALVIWFFFASITLYEFSTSVRLTEEKRLMAEFKQEAVSRLKPGQAAILRVTAGSDQAVVSLPALVYGIQPGSTEAEIVLMTNELPNDLLVEGVKAVAEVEIEYLTPAELVMRSMGKVLNRSQIPVSPQSEQPPP